jgi:hypothetical protein
MAKASNAFDITRRADYDKLDFTEFLEMLGRVAFWRFKENSVMKDKPLDEKLEPILDIVLSSFGLTLKAKVIEIEYISQSEDELDDTCFYT